MPEKSIIEKFINGQLSVWPLACNNFRALKNVEVKELNAGGLNVRVQFNPGRIISSSAKVDKASVAGRKCFLCKENRPPEQSKLDFEGRKGKKYEILVNPYPIFQDHLVIASDCHCAQSIWRRYVDMLDLAKAFQDFTILYNGPYCGASAPDHFHFQAGGRGIMPLENEIDRLLDACAAGKQVEKLEYVTSVQEADLYHYKSFTRGVFALRAETAKSAAKLFYRLVDSMDVVEGQNEPMFNLFSYYRKGEYRSVIISRAAHRPHHYFAENGDRLMISPGCVDMAGLFIASRREDYDKLSSGLLEEVLSEVSVSAETESKVVGRLMRRQPAVSVGIMSGREICFEILSDGAGKRTARYRNGKVEYDGTLYDELFFEAKTMSTMFSEPTFVLYDVTIGVDFHWERKEAQQFAGALKIIVEGEKITAVNMVGVEDYLLSVISSEMNAAASEEFLKAHAVISRSWIMSMISRRNSVPEVPADGTVDGAAIKWYGRESHADYDVCADDHCQRYQGLGRVHGVNAQKAIDETWGQVLTYGGDICDARFSKCCGGISERFSTCWEDRTVPYLEGTADNPSGAAVPDLADENTFRKWLDCGLEEAETAFCNTSDESALSQILNGYDMETKDFYRWKTVYDRAELSELVRRKSGIDFGDIRAIIPVSRGVSGRLYKMEIVGEKCSRIIGKELEIRRILSETHLKSSAFSVIYIDGNGNTLPEEQVAGHIAAGMSVPYEKIVLKGAGWGHGVGLCQIGAAVMAEKGYAYTDILSHYYPGTELADISRG